jgi:hypothetical protein
MPTAVPSPQWVPYRKNARLSLLEIARDVNREIYPSDNFAPLWPVIRLTAVQIGQICQRVKANTAARSRSRLGGQSALASPFDQQAMDRLSRPPQPFSANVLSAANSQCP